MQRQDTKNENEGVASYRLPSGDQDRVTLGQHAQLAGPGVTVAARIVPGTAAHSSCTLDRDSQPF